MVIKGSNPNAPDSTNLKNFFQNLLNKNAPSSNVTPVPTSSLSQMAQNLPGDQTS